MSHRFLWISAPNTNGLLHPPTTITLPQFHVQSLDDLLYIADGLVGLDKSASNFVHQMKQQLLQVDGESFLLPVEQRIRHFVWNRAAYNPRFPVKSVADKMVEKLSDLKAEVEAKKSEYATLPSVPRRWTQFSKAVQSHTFMETTYLTTVFVLVPKKDEKKWLSNYETLVEDTVVPRSSHCLGSTKEDALYTVVVFRPHSEVFKKRCSFEVKEELAVFDEKIKNRKEALIRWFHIYFFRGLSLLLHLKILQLFVETTLCFPFRSVTSFLLQLEKKASPKTFETRSSHRLISLTL